VLNLLLFTFDVAINQTFTVKPSFSSRKYLTAFQGAGMIIASTPLQL
jgi:hypothetical protein